MAWGMRNNALLFQILHSEYAIEFTYMCVFTYIYMYIYMYTHIYTNICIYIYTCMYMYMYTHIYTYIPIYTYMYTYIYVYIYIYINIIIFAISFTIERTEHVSPLLKEFEFGYETCFKLGCQKGDGGRHFRYGLVVAFVLIIVASCPSRQRLFYSTQAWTHLHQTSFPHTRRWTSFSLSQVLKLNCSLPSQNPLCNPIIRLPAFPHPALPNCTHGRTFLISQLVCRIGDASHLASNTISRATIESPPALGWKTRLLGLDPSMMTFVFQFSRRKGKWIKDQMERKGRRAGKGIDMVMVKVEPTGLADGF